MSTPSRGGKEMNTPHPASIDSAAHLALPARDALTSLSARTLTLLAPNLIQACAFERQAIAAMVANLSTEEIPALIKSREEGTDPPAAVRGMFRPVPLVVERCVRATLAAEPTLRDEVGNITAYVREIFSSLHSDSLKKITGCNPDNAHDALFDLSECALMHEHYKDELLTTKFWGEWFPYPASQGLTIRQILDTLPGLAATDVPDIIRKLENPESPSALPGPIRLADHDILHVAFGRSLLDQDEAFVIGATMGAVKHELLDTHVETMMTAFSRRYPEPYRISEHKLQAYTLGKDLCAATGEANLHQFPLRAFLDNTPDELRAAIRIPASRLSAVYREEITRIPDSLESYRLGKVIELL